MLRVTQYSNLYRWHQDVKPSNILVVSGNNDSPYDYQFKLADLGLSHFTSTMALQEDLAGEDTRGTRAYGMRPIVVTSCDF